ncbi:hypothetical protein [Arthrobacter sp. AD-310]
MKALDQQPEQRRARRGPVFVDTSGRRLRLAKVGGLAALGLVAAYVALLLVAFIGGSNVPAPYLPLPAAAGKPELPPPPPAPLSGAGDRPAETPAPAPVAAYAPGPGAEPGNVPAVPPAEITPAQPAEPAAPAAVPVPADDATAPGMSGTDPGMSGAAPGQATRPTAPAHP